MNKNQSPVATVTIYNYILTRGERQRLEATLDFPCENHILAETLAALQIEGDGEHGEVEVVWRQDLLRPLVFGAWDGREVCHIYELNYLTTLLSGLSPDDLVRYTAMVNHYLDEWSFTPEDAIPCTIANAINMVYNVSPNIVVVRDIENLEALGWHCIKENLMPECIDFPEQCYPYLNASKVGADYLTAQNGFLTNGCFVSGLPSLEELQTPYNGNMKLQPQSAPDFESQLGGM